MRVSGAWVLLACLLVGWAYVRTAAVTEDAFITFRVIDNALHGHGLVWNVGERVQPYTHPLWALLLLAVSAVSGEIFHTSLGLSLALTLATVALVVRHAKGRLIALWALLALLFSEAFIEYSSAALENALAHALVAAMVVAWRRFPLTDRHVWRLARRPVGDIADGDLVYQTEPMPVPGPGQFVLRVIYLSLDPTNRIWMSDQDQYMPPVQIGDTMRGGSTRGRRSRTGWSPAGPGSTSPRRGGITPGAEGSCGAGVIGGRAIGGRTTG